MSHHNRYWTTALGRRRHFNKIGHQHLSNILWFQKVFFGESALNSHTSRQLEKELCERYDGKRLLWKPLPIPEEIETLRKMGCIQGTDIVFEGKKIGTIRHIKG